MWRKFLCVSMVDFDIIAKKYLNDLYSELDLIEELEVDLTDDGVLTIAAENGEYVINKHFITKQIWYSSPVSSLKYFNYLNGEFVERKDPALTLRQALINDIKINN